MTAPFQWGTPGRGALRDIRILDFTHGLAGPFCTQMFAYFGAEVIKVESSARPDRFREAGQGGASPPTFNRIFAEFSRNKRDITINMKSEEGRALVRRLLAVSDVVAENFSAGVLKRWGLTYAQLEEEYPHLVVVSMPGMGSRGPHKHWITWGASLLAFSGVTWMWGYFDQQDPVGTQIAHPDYVGGILGAIGTLAALQERKRSGRGQAVELPQVAGAASLLPTTYLDYFVNRRVSPRRGNASPDYSPYGVYPCRGEDRWCVIAVTSEEDWTAFCGALGNPTWVGDPRFSSMLSRVQHRAAVDELISEWTRQRTPHEVMDLLQSAGVAAGAVQNGEDMYHDPQLRAREMVLEQPHPRLPLLAYPGVPARLSDAPAEFWRPAPDLGVDNDYVFHEVLGMAPDEVTALVQAGVIV